MNIDEAKKYLINNFKHEYRVFIMHTLPGDFAVVLAEKLKNNSLKKEKLENNSFKKEKLNLKFSCKKKEIPITCINICSEEGKFYYNNTEQFCIGCRYNKNK